MEPEGSLPCSQEPATGPYQSQTNPIHSLHSIYLIPLLILSSHICLSLSSDLFLSVHSNKILYVFLTLPMRAFCNIHLVPLDLIPVILQYPPMVSPPCGGGACVLQRSQELCRR
jgi:hypothetical protein